jgi:methylmalonyl-CoA mutase N-terminal domain/subunit
LPADEIERLAWEYIKRIDELGGAVAAIEAGYQMEEIDQAAYEYTKSIDDGERVIVGLNRFAIDGEPSPTVFPIDPELESGQRDRLARLRAERNSDEVAARLAELSDAARGTQNLLYPMKEALRASATLGEVSDALRAVFGEYRP